MAPLPYTACQAIAKHNVNGALAVNITLGPGALKNLFTLGDEQRGLLPVALLGQRADEFQGRIVGGGDV